MGVLPPFTIHHYGLGLEPRNWRNTTAFRDRSKTRASSWKACWPIGALVSRPYSVRPAPGPRPWALRWDGGSIRLGGAGDENGCSFTRESPGAAPSRESSRMEFSANPHGAGDIFHESIAEVEQLAAVPLRFSSTRSVGIEHSQIPDKRRAADHRGFSDRSRPGPRVGSLADRGVQRARGRCRHHRRVFVLGAATRSDLGPHPRTHRDPAGEEKTSVMHVLYVRDTVDEAIYGIEDWQLHRHGPKLLLSGHPPPDEPELQPGPPRAPLPNDVDVVESALVPGWAVSRSLRGTRVHIGLEWECPRIIGRARQRSGRPLG